MCIYVKDNGEQCGIDSHDGDYCHLHEDDVDSKGADSGAETFGGLDGVTYCDDCETAVRATVLELAGAAFKPDHMHAKQGLACDCSSVEYEWAHPTLPKEEVPDSWL